MTLTSPVSQPTVDIDNTRVKFVRQREVLTTVAQMMMVTTMMMTDDNKINEEVTLMLSALQRPLRQIKCCHLTAAELPKLGVGLVGN